MWSSADADVNCKTSIVTRGTVVLTSFLWQFFEIFKFTSVPAFDITFLYIRLEGVFVKCSLDLNFNCQALCGCKWLACL